MINETYIARSTLMSLRSRDGPPGSVEPPGGTDPPCMAKFPVLAIRQNQKTIRKYCEIQKEEIAMKLINQRRFWSWMGALLIFGASMSVHAAGTGAGTTISNQATINYSVGGVAQSAIPSSPTGNSDPLAGATTDFVVDNKVIVTVAEITDSAATVSPGQAIPAAASGATVNALSFTVTNGGNEHQDYVLTAANLAAAQSVPFTVPVADDSDVTTPFELYLDVNSDNQYTEGTDTILPTSGGNYYLDEVAPDAVVRVLVVAAIPAALADGNIAGVSLVATTYDGNNGTGGALGALTAETAGADDPTVVDVVFADVAGTDDATGARDGQHSDRDAFVVASAQISIAKTVSTIWWNPAGVGNATIANPKAIPGAYVQYSVTITNDVAATASASLTTIADTLPATLLHDADMIAAGTGLPENAANDGFKVTHASGRGVAPATQYFTTNTADAVDIAGQVITANIATALPAEAGYTAGELKPGESVTLIFNAIVQ